MKKANEQTTKQMQANVFIADLELLIMETFDTQNTLSKTQFYARQSDIWVYIDDSIKALEELREKYQFIVNSIKEQINESEN